MAGKETIQSDDGAGTAEPRNRPPGARQIERFFQALAETCDVRAAAAAANILTGVAYRYRRTDPAFAAAWRDSVAASYERLETALLRRALDSVDVPDADPDETGPEGMGPDGIGPDGIGPDGIGPDETGPEEPDRADSDVAAAAAPVRPNMPPLSSSEVQIALALLARYRPAPPPAGQPARPPRATAEKTDAALTRKLDALARKMGGAA